MKLTELLKEFENIDLPLGKFAVFGSGPLTAHEIRETNDIDIIVLPATYDQLKNEGWKEKIWPSGSKYLAKGNFEVCKEWICNTYNPDIKKLIENAEIINGVPFVKLEEVKSWKQAFGREKDLKDVELIDQFLAEQI
ncbi:MAG: hypothetical protein Q7R43_03565 [Candidatus Daviesbacteria bacterium]|nr:hypothetical protein [Candidatus Daviesbacteria bacterium]